jgi:ATP-binding cassette subfamily B protein
MAKDKTIHKADRGLSPSGFRSLQLIGPFLQPYRKAILGALVALMVAATTVLSIVGGLRYVIDKGFLAQDPSMLDKTLAQLLVAIVVLAFATFARYSLVSWLGERVAADLRRAVYNHILKLSPGFFEVTRAGDILSRLSSDTALLQSLIGSSISVALRNCILLIGGIGMMLLTNAKLTGYVMIGIVAIVVPIVIIGRRVRKLSRSNQERVADLTAAAEETIYGIRTVQAFVHEDISRKKFNDETENVVSAATRHIRARGLLTAIVIMLVFSGIGVMLWIGGHDVLNGTITAGQLSAFVGYAAIAAGAIGAVSETMGDLNRASGATERIFELLNEVPTIIAPTNPVAMPSPPRGDLAFEHVNFIYASRPDKPALDDISFTVKPGERVAVVGPSGAGKTTLYQMILRFYDPTSGVVRLDGVDIKTANPQDVRSRIGIVPQDSVIFSTTAAENIAYGNPDATPDMVRAAARAAFADDFLTALPQGYDTHLGEKGVRLSGGQRQRIAIARAILRNPSILLLDEATSALDAESERFVQDALDVLMQGRTTLIIAHRLATVTKADRILVLDQGKLVASGTHQSLIAEGGLYARLAALQFDQGG